MIRRNKERNGRNKDKKATQGFGRRNKTNKVRIVLKIVQN